METPYLDYLDAKERFPRSLVHGPIRRYLRSRLDRLAEGSRLLDAGCGNGIESGPLADRLRVHGIDYQASYVARCAQRWPRGQWQAGDLRQLPFADGFFAGVLLNQVAEHLDEPREVFKEVRRVLAEGGLLILATPNYGNFLWPLVENTWHRFFVREFDAEENHVTPYDTASLREHLSWFEIEDIGTVCLGSILVATARR